MSVKVLQPITVPSYLTDGKQLLFVQSVSDKEAMCEDAMDPHGEPVMLPVSELARKWRRVEPEEDS